MTVLLAAASWGLASAIGGLRAGVAALLFVPLSLAFLHLSDARAAVLVWPIVGLAVWLLIEPIGLTRHRRGAVMAVVLAAAVFVHPLQGFIAIIAIGLTIALVPRLRQDCGLLPTALALLMTAPQWATTAGISLPPWALIVAFALAAVGWYAIGSYSIGRYSVGTAPHPPIEPIHALDHRRVRLGIALAALAAAVIAIVVAPGGPLPLIVAAIAGAAASAVLIVGALHSVLVASRLPGYALLWAVPATGLLAGIVALAIPATTQLGESIAYEVPKTTNYLAWPFLAIATAVGLAALWQRDARPKAFRAGIVAILLVAAAAPIALRVADPLALGEHRLSEATSILWRTATDGYWQGYPDARTLMDEPEADVVAALRAEIDAGRLRRDTQVLHVAASFQAWRSIPLAAFTGVIETTASLDPETSIHTAGGRLHSIAELPTLLAGPYEYVVLEPAGLPPDVAAPVTAAGYRQVYSNERAQILTR
jgi:hypothetical protein